MANKRQSQVNLDLDFNFRGQALVPPSSWFLGLMSVAASRAAAGTEISTGAGYTGYARQEVVNSLANWSGTQGDGTTAASSGTNDYISNNVAITYSAALAVAWNGILGVALYDALSAGNQRFFGVIVDSLGNPLTRSFAIGEAVVLAPGSLRIYSR